MEIETLGELLYACNENRLARFKGFGEKTQENVKQSINFFLKSQGSHLFAEIEHYVWEMHKLLKKKFEKHHMELTGSFRRQMEIIDSIEWITTATIKDLEEFFAKNNFDTIDVGASTISVKGEEKILLSFTSITSSLFYSKLFESSSSEEFSLEWKKKFPAAADNQYSSEEDIFKTASLNYIPPFLREKFTVIEKAGTETFKNIIQPTEIRGIIHSHSNWSDGSNTIEEMAKGCIERGLEYLVISDHSKSAFYANGLQEDRIVEQHKYVDELNKKLAPFRIFKSIECDILNDGCGFAVLRNDQRLAPVSQFADDFRCVGLQITEGLDLGRVLHACCAAMTSTASVISVSTPHARRSAARAGSLTVHVATRQPAS